ncbi:LuxR C-terminal-related transcriptional regulator [Pseudoduganella sp. UC29_106]|uniref:LuxR C-terminal-related transcriptional regulator n=1 Tax=Pseudoduganella sp. UC29_106 TaxID=3374553 RepID=UPI003756945C
MLLSKTNVHIMRGEAVLTAGLQTILGAQAELNVTLHAQCPLALNTAQIVVADYESAIDLAHSDTLEQITPPPRILIVARSAREVEVRQAMEAGVYGYVLQDASVEELLKAIQALSRGVRYMADAVSLRLADSLRRESLTARETDVLTLLAQGSCNKTIAQQLGIGVGTVKTHVRGLMTKLHAKARTHVVVVASESGLIRPQAPLQTLNYD